jgi:glutathione S-transferase
MVLTLYGFPFSTCTQRVLAVLLEKDLPYELVEVNLFKGDQKSEAHLARQPFGKIPVLEDDGFFVFESRAISKYLAKKFATKGTNLIPDDGDFKAYGVFEQVGCVSVLA